MKRGPYDLHREPRSPLNWRAASPLSIGAARAEYFAWQDALVRLVAMLRGALVEYEPVAPTAVAFPWIDGQPTSRVLSDGFPGGLLTVSLGLGPTRPATRRSYETDLEVEARRANELSARSNCKSRCGAGVTSNQ
ncbi:hypothetical protein AB8B21_24440 [Tardiphaga sp. 866_E4_N2_1]|uniref:hypothetical protein n=1 Tax=unclassified Tardiphaga TaxID=2631404 RepID=UPI003F295CED